MWASPFPLLGGRVGITISPWDEKLLDPLGPTEGLPEGAMPSFVLDALTVYTLD